MVLKSSRTRKAEAGSSQVKGHPQLGSDFKASLGYAKPCLVGPVAQWVKPREGTSTDSRTHDERRELLKVVL